MPKLKGKKQWTEAEIVVLTAIFASSNFSVGDDNRPECKKIAEELGRSSGTVDRQWRNIKDYLADLESGKTGRKVKMWADILLEDPKTIKRLALYYCKKMDWKLEDLLKIEVQNV